MTACAPGIACAYVAELQKKVAEHDGLIAQAAARSGRAGRAPCGRRLEAYGALCQLLATNKMIRAASINCHGARQRPGWASRSPASSATTPWADAAFCAPRPGVSAMKERAGCGDPGGPRHVREIHMRTMGPRSRNSAPTPPFPNP